MRLSTSGAGWLGAQLGTTNTVDFSHCSIGSLSSPIGPLTALFAKKSTGTVFRFSGGAVCHPRLLRCCAMLKSTHVDGCGSATTGSARLLGAPRADERGTAR